MDIKDLRYIVLLLNTEVEQFMSNKQRISTNDGRLFCSLQSAKEYAIDALKEKLCSRFVIGFFVWDKDAESIGIDLVETYGFKYDSKNISQLTLFK